MGSIDVSALEGAAAKDWSIDPARFAFAPRKLRAVCIGAGYSGLILAHRVKYEKDFDFLDLEIYEKNTAVAGAWLENVYPGVGCDVPAHSYVFPFEPNPNWSKFYVGGEEIRKYIDDTANKYGLKEHVTFNTKLTKSHWNEDRGKWELELEQGGSLIRDEADFLINAGGILNKWKWPQIEGLHSFEGKLFHSARWDPNYDWPGKKVAVIGNGSSAIQVVPSVQRKAQKLVNYIRRPTWVSPSLCGNVTKDGMGTNFAYTEEEKRQFREDPAAFLEYRKTIEKSVNAVYSSMLDGSEEHNLLQNLCETSMKDKLANSPELLEKLMPKTKPGCRRLSPGNGYLEAIQKDNASVCFSGIKRITKRGIVTDEGEEEFDLIVCATGFNTTFIPNWDFVGRDGHGLDHDWKQTPEAYFSVCAAHIPNYFMFTGPNSPIGHGSVPQMIGWSADYMLSWIKKAAIEDIKSIAVKESAVRAFNDYAQENMKRCVWSKGCQAWYNNGRVVTAMYPGSVLHYKAAMESIRGEHFDIRYNTSNPFMFLANGELAYERAEDGDTAFYLK